jgi:hypothetical protein
MTTFWFLVVGSLVLLFALLVGVIDHWQDRRPRGVDARDWQRVSNERRDAHERARLNRVMRHR